MRGLNKSEITKNQILQLNKNKMPINYKLYPRDWKSRIVPAVNRRSKGKCEQCSRANYSLIYSMKVAHSRKGKKCFRALWLDEPPVNTSYRKIKVILTVAHLDHDPFNFNVTLDRLKHLCQLCHFRYDSENRARKHRETKAVVQQETDHYNKVNSHRKIFTYTNSSVL